MKKDTVTTTRIALAGNTQNPYNVAAELQVIYYRIGALMFMLRNTVDILAPASPALPHNSLAVASLTGELKDEVVVMQSILDRLHNEANTLNKLSATLEPQNTALNNACIVADERWTLWTPLQELPESD